MTTKTKKTKVKTKMEKIEKAMTEIQSKKSLMEIDIYKIGFGLIESQSRGGHSVADALREIIDNSYSVYMESDNKKSFKNPYIHVYFDSIGERIIVKDNMGGISLSKLADVIQYGNNVEGRKWGIGYFGMGLKSASFCISNNFKVITWYTTDPVAVEVPMNIVDIKENKGIVQVRTTEEECEPGTTTIILSNLKNNKIYSESWIDNFADKAGEIYGEVNKKNQEVEFEIYSNGKKKEINFKPLSNYIAELIGGPCSPAKELNYTNTSTMTKLEIDYLLSDSGIEYEIIEKDGKTSIVLDKDVDTRFIVGLAWESHPTEGYGADVWYNNRRIIAFDRSMGFTDEERGIASDTTFKKPHATASRIRALVTMEGFNEKTPANNRKNDLDKSRHIYNTMAGLLNHLYRRYKDVLRDYENDLKSILFQHREELKEVRPLDEIPVALIHVKTPGMGDGMTGDEKAVQIYKKWLPKILPTWDEKNEKTIDLKTHVQGKYPDAFRTTKEEEAISKPIKPKPYTIKINNKEVLKKAQDKARLETGNPRLSFLATINYIIKKYNGGS